jgi:hypothetical protein
MPPPIDIARDRWMLPLLLAALACGCGPPRVTFAPVEGTVTRDGKPAPKVKVIFFADGDTVGPQVSGLTDDKGHFHLRKDDQQDGAPIGHHRVCLVELSGPSPPPRSPLRAKGLPSPDTRRPADAPRFPREYASPGETPLRAEVRPGPQTIDFQLP